MIFLKILIVTIPLALSQIKEESRDDERRQRDNHHNSIQQSADNNHNCTVTLLDEVYMQLSCGVQTSHEGDIRMSVNIPNYTTTDNHFVQNVSKAFIQEKDSFTCTSENVQLCKVTFLKPKMKMEQKPEKVSVSSNVEFICTASSVFRDLKISWSTLPPSVTYKIDHDKHSLYINGIKESDNGLEVKCTATDPLGWTTSDSIKLSIILPSSFLIYAIIGGVGGLLVISIIAIILICRRRNANTQNPNFSNSKGFGNLRDTQNAHNTNNDISSARNDIQPSDTVQNYTSEMYYENTPNQNINSFEETEEEENPDILYDSPYDQSSSKCNNPKDNHKNKLFFQPDDELYEPIGDELYDDTADTENNSITSELYEIPDIEGVQEIPSDNFYEVPNENLETFDDITIRHIPTQLPTREEQVSKHGNKNAKVVETQLSVIQQLENIHRSKISKDTATRPPLSLKPPDKGLKPLNRSPSKLAKTAATDKSKSPVNIPPKITETAAPVLTKAQKSKSKHVGPPPVSTKIKIPPADSPVPSTSVSTKVNKPTVSSPPVVSNVNKSLAEHVATTPPSKAKKLAAKNVNSPPVLPKTKKPGAEQLVNSPSVLPKANKAATEHLITPPPTSRKVNISKARSFKSSSPKLNVLTGQHLHTSPPVLHKGSPSAEEHVKLSLLASMSQEMKQHSPYTPSTPNSINHKEIIDETETYEVPSEVDESSLQSIHYVTSLNEQTYENWCIKSKKGQEK